MTPSNRRPFLSARWRNLIVMNFLIEPEILRPYVPAGTELDFYQDRSFLSLVAFLFEKTKLFGTIPIWPFQTFEEINLRFYVRRNVQGETRRAVCFLREIVPHRPIAWAANSLYNESYVCLPTEKNCLGRDFSYRWKSRGRWHELAAKTQGELRPLKEASFESFILEHYWGYVRQRDGGTKEYRVEHPAWKFWDAECSRPDPELGNYFGEPFARCLQSLPHSCFVAQGSEVKVFAGKRIPR